MRKVVVRRRPSSERPNYFSANTPPPTTSTSPGGLLWRSLAGSAAPGVAAAWEEGATRGSTTVATATVSCRSALTPNSPLARRLCRRHLSQSSISLGSQGWGNTDGGKAALLLNTKRIVGLILCFFLHAANALSTNTIQFTPPALPLSLADPLIYPYLQ